MQDKGKDYAGFKPRGVRHRGYCCGDYPSKHLKAGHYRPASETILLTGWDVVIAEAPIV